MPLTALECRQTKPSEKLTKLSDMGGLQLWVYPTGTKLWRFAYRFGAKQKLLAIGRYPATTLLQARMERDKAKVQLDEGRDPSHVKRLERIEREFPGDSFEIVAQEYLAKLRREGRAETTMTKLEWLLAFALPILGPLSVGAIRPIEILAVLRTVEKRGRYDSARRLRSTIGAVCRYAVATARAEVDPTAALQGALTAPILAFVRAFAAAVFSAGGHILHGSHPSLVGPLIEQAKDYIAKGGRKDCLTLAVSKHWSKDSARESVQEWRQTCIVYETAEATAAPSPRDASLQILRQWMADRCDAFVAVGGQWWKEIAGRAGVPIEAGLAMQRGLPCFLLGGLGGAAGDYVRDHGEVIRSLKNGLDDDTNRRLALQEDVGSLVDTVCSQLARLPLVRGRVSDGISFRILALDGGGIKGAFTAAVLTTLEQALGSSVSSQFDLIAGTSTGGILALGLGMGLRPSDMLRFYRDRGPVVFPIMRLHRKLESQLWSTLRPKYSQRILREELEKALYPDHKPKVLGDSVCRLVIPAYEVVGGGCHVFRTPHNKLLTGDSATDAAAVALATAAAPTYLPAAVVENMISNASYFDGGVWANCPAMAAIVEAVCYLGVPLDRIDVLSIGTTEEPFTVKSKAQAGWARWGRTLIDLLMNAQMESSVRHAQLLVGEPRFLRVNTMTTPGAYKLDGSRQIEELIALGNRKASERDILYQVQSRFLNGIDAIDWKSTL